MKRGIFVTLEGIDGCGKSTQALILKKFFEEKGFEVLLTREPGGSNIGPSVRKILFNEEMNPVSEFLLFAADRKQHVDTVIRPALKAGKVVISDRFLDSSVAYQGYGRGVSLDFISHVHAFILNGTLPDLTVLFDVPPETGLGRIDISDRIERAGIEFLAAVRKGYLEIAKKEKRFVIINGEASKEEVAKEMIKEISRRILRKNRDRGYEL